MLEFRPKSTGMIKTSAALDGMMFQGVDIIKGTTTATIVIYDSGANTGNILFQASNTATDPTSTIELSYPVAGTGKLWAEITGTQANVVIRYK